MKTNTKNTQISCHTIEISTLGHFDVKKNNNSLVSSAPGSKKIWELFKFMLTHRKRSFTPENLMETLWSRENYSDSRSTLRRQMHRLRQILEEVQSNEEQLIVFNNGFYSWNTKINIQLDIDLFEKAVQMAEEMKEARPEGALINYRMALSLYQGDYLSECIEQLWVIPIRNYYRRLYLKSVYNITNLLKVQGNWNEILQICERAIQVEVYEEEIHLRYIEALLQEKEVKQAQKHYEYFTTFLYQEMGLKPSPALKSAYKRILATNHMHSSIEDLEIDLDNKKIENAFYCEPYVFKMIYELECRRSERSGNMAMICMITMNHPSTVSLEKKQQAMTSLEKHLLEQLRKGDTITRWDNSNFLVLLPGLNDLIMEKVLSRILNSFYNYYSESPDTIQTHYLEVLPPQARSGQNE
ncbi:BTAD domain-containing putative transcriptional regulator [Alkaliphilus peptidifermentans]|uniref:Transcriptional regulatory protein, C terminal n=1 Tax=Alkaliphilus peptidifermentans DSM 18978 TaxID=1120976 RepID=A0A1G5BWC7_9FIRM|nr:BTAD domain-containing putative transcriptional regulator [Alkaliphilus peptidifermentans]SCX94376.1 Transcriptional regulatory protein, C terminal [Alkaliphilus peptidifermentans DSM 18978]